MGIINYNLSENAIVQFNYSKRIYKLERTWRNFKINDNTWFDDMIWDFNEKNINNRARYLYIHNFNKIPEPFILYVKITIFEEIKKRKNSYLTVDKTREILQEITQKLYSENIKDVRLIDQEVVKKFIDFKFKKCKPNYVETVATRYKKFIYTLEDVKGYNLLDITNYLTETMRLCRTMRSKKAVNNYIPDKFLNQIVSLAIKDMDNQNLKIDDRIMACLIVILAETGMRSEEVSLLETNKLDTIEINDKQQCYLKFLTFKSSTNNEEARETYSMLTDKALKAYKTCENLVERAIESLNEIPRLRLIWSLYTKQNINAHINVSKLREMVSSIEETVLKELENKTTKYLFISSSSGLQKKGNSAITENLERFFVRHENDFTLEGIPANQKKNIKIFQIKSKSKYEKFIPFDKRDILPFDKVKEKKFYYVNPHMFRVTVCTKLFMQDVHLDYIVKHLNHLTEEMASYYNKSEEFIDALVEGTTILSSIANKEGLIETDPTLINNEFMQREMQNEEFKINIGKVNEFLKVNKLNITNDLKKIIKLLEKTSSPALENEFGICIRTVVNGLCQRRKYFSSTSDNYFVEGVLPTYRYIHFSYERFQQKLTIVNHNKKIAEEDDRYMLEYEREVKALKIFTNNNLMEQIKLLDKDINKLGHDVILNKYPQIEHILLNLDCIREEIAPWIE